MVAHETTGQDLLMGHTLDYSALNQTKKQCSDVATQVTVSLPDFANQVLPQHAINCIHHRLTSRIAHLP